MTSVKNTINSALNYVNEPSMLNAYKLHANAYNGSNWIERTFDPSGAQMNYNSYENALANIFSAEQAEIARQFSAEQAQISRQWSAQEAQKTRDWQEKMSNTAYQRATEDMRSAGLNPYLLYANSGSGAATPAGATGSSSVASSYGASGRAASVSASNATLLNNITSLFGTIVRSATMIGLKKIK